MVLRVAGEGILQNLLEKLEGVSLLLHGQGKEHQQIN